MFQIISKEFKEYIREKMNWIFFLLFPIVLIFLLGNLLSSMDHAEEAIGDIKIQYLIDTSDMTKQIAIETFIQSVRDENNISFAQIYDLEEAKEEAGNDQVTAVVEFSGDPLGVHIYEGTNQIKNRTVAAIMNGFIKMNQSINAVMKEDATKLLTISTNKENYIQQKDLGVNRSMLDYYAVTMLVMMCLMSMMIGAGTFMGERQAKTLNRLIIAPKKRVYIFLQKILGLVGQTLIQVTVIMVVSVTVFHAHYAVNGVDNVHLFLMFFIVTLAMISCGAVIGLLVKANPIAILMPILWVMMFFGGTYSKEINISGITNHMPSYVIQQAAFDLAIFGRSAKVNQIIIISFFILMAALILGSYLFNKMEEER